MIKKCLVVLVVLAAIVVLLICDIDSRQNIQAERDFSNLAIETVRYSELVRLYWIAEGWRDSGYFKSHGSRAEFLRIQNEILGNIREERLIDILISQE